VALAKLGGHYHKLEVVPSILGTYLKVFVAKKVDFQLVNWQKACVSNHYACPCEWPIIFQQVTNVNPGLK
jgi:hypothetical protein